MEQEEDYFDEVPQSPEIPLQYSPNIQDSSDRRVNHRYSSDSASAVDETPRRPITKKRRLCQGLDFDQSDEESSEGLSEMGEIKTLLKLLCKKVDKNEKCLRELQQTQSR